MRAHRPNRSLPRTALAALLFAACVAWVGGLAATVASAAGSPAVRVLLVESKAPVAIGGASGELRVGVARETHGLVVDGEPVGVVWSPRGDGPWRVDGRRYRGRLELRAVQGQVLVVNHVELEDYVAATVGGEMPASWPEQALAAQAVATRTYALHQRDRRRGEPWDVRATEQSQVYRGIESESSPTRRAADATRGEILTHAGRPILAAFHSTSGGRTASASEVWGERVPYLGSIDVEHEEDAPFTYWRTVIAPETLDDLLAAMGADLGPLHAIEVDGRTESGRVERLIATGRARRIYIRGDHLRTLVESLGLRSRLFDIRDTPEGFAFVGSGFGHGVGMSQWGARELARRGTPYQRILARFYPGARLEAWRAERVASQTGASKQGR
ncbi:MAG: SpoIID/LytB domain-containing protein [Deltaproteobacteria bacterium]|nr:SpoIID/LytB domain-containing protein [Deltaproteobacteria bacterium]